MVLERVVVPERLLLTFPFRYEQYDRSIAS